MTTTVFLHGHGSWSPSLGYTKVPRGCSVSFYTHFAKLLNQTMVKLIFEGTYANDLERTVAQFHTLPNLSLSSLTQGQWDWAERKFAVPGAVMYRLPPDPPHTRKSLATIMDECTQALGFDLDFRWLCCQSLSLRRVGGRALGLNASDRTAQAGHEGYYLFKWKEGNVQKTRWVKSDSSIHRDL